MIHLFALAVQKNKILKSWYTFFNALDIAIIFKLRCFFHKKQWIWKICWKFLFFQIEYLHWLVFQNAQIAILESFESARVGGGDVVL